ncbi:MAG: flavodoxin domain-containing protein, partial [Coriobacteriia bacterium]
LMPLGMQVSKAVAKVLDSGWEIDTIAPSHGVIWRGEALGKAIELYGRRTSGETLDKVVITYSTMWGSTDVLARAICDGVASTGVAVEIYDLAVSQVATVTHELLDARGFLLGSPTLHHGMLYRVAGYLQYLAGLKPAGKIAGSFGSFGWSSGATKQMNERLEAIGFELPFESYTQKYRPTASDIDDARAWGIRFAEEIRNRG